MQYTTIWQFIVRMMETLLIETLRHRSTLYLFLTVCWQHSWLTTAIIDSALLAMLTETSKEAIIFGILQTLYSWNIKSFFSSGLSCYLKINLIKGPNNSCRASLLFWRRIAPAHCKCSGLLGSSSRRWRHNKNGKCVETTLTKICNQANSFAKLGWNNLQEFLI